MSKKEQLISEIKHQLNVELDNDKDNMFNQKRNLLYIKISKQNKRQVLNYLDKHNIQHNEHLNDYYWISLKGV